MYHMEGEDRTQSHMREKFNIYHGHTHAVHATTCPQHTTTSPSCQLRPITTSPPGWPPRPPPSSCTMLQSCTHTTQWINTTRATSSSHPGPHCPPAVEATHRSSTPPEQHPAHTWASAATRSRSHTQGQSSPSSPYAPSPPSLFWAWSRYLVVEARLAAAEPTAE